MRFMQNLPLKAYQRPKIENLAKLRKRLQKTGYSGKFKASSLFEFLNF
jgi:hypothetical protein